jgi:hypothetical protein
MAVMKGTGLHYKGELLAFPANIRYGWKLLTATNTLAYNGKGLRVQNRALRVVSKPS